MNDDLVTLNDEAVLAQQDMPTLASWWDVLNRWRWPDELSDPEPPHKTERDRRGQLMCRIEEMVGMRMCFRYSSPWVGVSEEEFNDFWRGCFEGHLPSQERYQRRLREKVLRKATGGHQQ